ncbi:hypothetical protein ROZALSC1DRAFT_19848 [Rozella allomycis CSF55]|uniref:Uncharacterized protein n=1 Tax=Rozella allomycis (strain CSF55) TaxID=988480 RepID=A0A4P9YDV5_ROZAC|nr:hypothetical protein ROZALSC1DRAFT_19848 [Rozella allomycis CSF55]
MPPTVPINHYFGSKNQQNRTKVLFYYSMLIKGSGSPRHSIKSTLVPQKFNYELFNCNNFNIRYWSWNYRGCWHQTCPPIVPR